MLDMTFNDISRFPKYVKMIGNKFTQSYWKLNLGFIKGSMTPTPHLLFELTCTAMPDEMKTMQIYSVVIINDWKNSHCFANSHIFSL